MTTLDIIGTYRYKYDICIGPAEVKYLSHSLKSNSVSLNRFR